MILKPKKCNECPARGWGDYYVPDECVEGAETFVLGQNPGPDEENEGRPFVGKTGKEMELRYFPLAKLVRGVNVSIGNTIRCRMFGTNNLPSGKQGAAIAVFCQSAHFRPPQSTRLTVAQGAWAWRAKGQTTKISDWRGFLAPDEYQGDTV